jgi:baculoviral IAP repeat-containing protein 6
MIAGIVYSNLPLSGFTRRLFLQVLLEDEKILVAFKSTSQLHKGHLGATSSQIYHPKFGAGHRCKIVNVGLQTTCGEVLRMVSGRNSYDFALDDLQGFGVNLLKKIAKKIPLVTYAEIDSISCRS